MTMAVLRLCFVNLSAVCAKDSFGMRWRSLTGFVVLLLLSTSARAVNGPYFVKTNGNDGNTGLSEAQAFRTISKYTDFVHCAFVDGGELIRNDRVGSGNALTNCIISGFDKYLSDTTPSALDADFEFNYCCLDNSSSAEFPTGTELSNMNSFEGDPGFAWSWTSHPRFGNLFDYDLNNSSPCLDAGPAVTFIPDVDHDGEDRYGAYWDVGAQEKQ